MKQQLTRPYQLLVGFIFLGLLIFPMILHSSPLPANQTVGTSYDKKAFIKELVPTAQTLSKSYGIKPSILIGQACLETDYGSQLIAHRYHNLYYLPAKDGQENVELATTVIIHQKQESVTKRFAVYPSFRACLFDYVATLKAGNVWKPSLYQTMVTGTNKGVAKALEESGFSTDSQYAKKLLEIIKENNLEQYDY